MINYFKPRILFILLFTDNNDTNILIEGNQNVINS